MEDLEVLVNSTAVKAMGDGKIAGWLVRFTDEHSPDLDGDYFTADTDFDLHDNEAKTSVYYHHGLDKRLKDRRLGVGTVTRKDAGLWLEAQLEMRDEYEHAVYQMVEAGKLGFSSAALPNLVRREPTKTGAAWLAHWPLGPDATLTPRPAAGPELTRVTSIKSLMTDSSQEANREPEAAEDAADMASTQGEPSDNKQHIVEVRTMSDETTQKVEAVGRDEFATFSKSVNDALNGILERLSNSGSAKDIGYIAPDSTNDHAGTKSMADFLTAVMRGNTKRLATVYGATKDMTEGTGNQGGYLVPTDYSQQLLNVMSESSEIIRRVTRVPVSVASGEWPVLDVFAAPTAGAGNTAMAAGITAATTAEGATYTETQATIDQLTWRVHKIGGFTEVSNELVSDSIIAIEALLRALFASAINARVERHILRGSGVGEPLGILNAACAVAITPATNNAFGEADALTMHSRLLPVSGRSSVAWLMHPSIIPDFNGFTASNVDLVDWRSPLGASLLGYPILYSGHLPQADASGAVILADLGAYLLFEKQGLNIAYSEHAAFTSGKGTWRFDVRLDGMPWMKSAVTLGGPGSAYTQSPFVYHND